MTVMLIYTVTTTENAFEVRHYLGIAFTTITLATLFYNKNVFSLALFATLVIGNFCGLSSIHTITTQGFYFNISTIHIPIYWGQPVYSLLLAIYLVFNSGLFTGIVTKEYWKDFLTRTNDLEPILTIVNVDQKLDEQNK